MNTDKKNNKNQVTKLSHSHANSVPWRSDHEHFWWPAWCVPGRCSRWRQIRRMLEYQPWTALSEFDLHSSPCTSGWGHHTGRHLLSTAQLCEPVMQNKTYLFPISLLYFCVVIHWLISQPVTQNKTCLLSVSSLYFCVVIHWLLCKPVMQNKTLLFSISSLYFCVVIHWLISVLILFACWLIIFQNLVVKSMCAIDKLTMWQSAMEDVNFLKNISCVVINCCSKQYLTFYLSLFFPPFFFFLPCHSCLGKEKNRPKKKKKTKQSLL